MGCVLAPFAEGAGKHGVLATGTRDKGTIGVTAKTDGKVEHLDVLASRFLGIETSKVKIVV